MLEEFLAVVSAVNDIYQTYQTLAFAFGIIGGPSPGEILDATSKLKQQLDALNAQLQTISNDIKQLLKFEQQAFFDTTLQNIQNVYAQAETGLNELREWIDGAMTDARKLDDAGHDSQMAAIAFRDNTAFFQKPDANGINVFDHRMALPYYLFSITIRRAVLAASNPQFFTRPVYQQEFLAHAHRLSEIIRNMDDAIHDFPGGRAESDGNIFYQIWSQDMISGYETSLIRSNWFPGTQSDLNEILRDMTAISHANVRDIVGLTKLMKFRDTVDFDALGRPVAGVWTPWMSVATTGDRQTGVNQRHVAAVSHIANGASIFWTTKDGAIESSYSDPRASGSGSSATFSKWAPPQKVTDRGVNDFNDFDVSLVAVSSSPGGTSLFWPMRDGSLWTISSDPNTFPPQWLKPTMILGARSVALAGGLPGQIAALSLRPGQLHLFWPDWTTAEIKVGIYGGGGFPLTPVSITGPENKPDRLTAVGGEKVGVNLFWITGDGSIRGLSSTDPLEFGGVQPFAVAGPSVARGGICGVSGSPGTVMVFWPDPHGAINAGVRTPVSPQWKIGTITDPGAAHWSSPVVALSSIPDDVSLYWLGADRSIRGMSFQGQPRRSAWNTIGAPISYSDLSGVITNPIGGAWSLFLIDPDGFAETPHESSPSTFG
jgi:hypothetical protein